jgi:hypothetical protein
MMPSLCENGQLTSRIFLPAKWQMGVSFCFASWQVGVCAMAAMLEKRSGTNK